MTGLRFSQHKMTVSLSGELLEGREKGARKKLEGSEVRWSREGSHEAEANPCISVAGSTTQE
jgi:hypothetical protein